MRTFTLPEGVEPRAMGEAHGRAYATEIAEIAAHPERSSQEVDLILIAKNLERVADHATNIAEDVILTAESLNLKHSEKLLAAKEAST